MERLFTYGTLMAAEVIEAVLGYPAGPATAAELPDFGCYRVRDRPFPAILAETGGVTSGCVYRNLTATALRQLDQYEGDLYYRRRVCVQLCDGRSLEAWTYVLHPSHSTLLSSEPWEYRHFVEHQLDGMLKSLRGVRR